MSTPSTDLPYVDEHTIRIAAPRAEVWTAVEHYAATSLRFIEGSPLTKILGTQPAQGFAVSESVPGERLILTGRHRFSQYLLTFELTDAGNATTQLRAQSYAAFPGIRGLIYRALVIGTRSHAVITKRMLRSIRRLTAELS